MSTIPALASNLSATTPISVNLPSNLSKSFADAFTSALTAALEKVGVDPKSVSVQTTGASQNVVTSQSSANPMAVITAQSAPAVSRGVAPVTSDPVAFLKSALSAAGVDSSSLNLSESDTEATYPGGSYRNHLVTAYGAHGQSQSYDVGLMMHSPDVTVMEVENFMKLV